MAEPDKRNHDPQPVLSDVPSAFRSPGEAPPHPADVAANAAAPGFCDAATPFVADYARPAPGFIPAARPRAAPRVYAALDLGTNNCRLIIVEPSPRGFAVTDTFSRIVRLGEGLGLTGALSEAAMRRAIEALKICADKIRRSGASRSRLIATEACRAAVNGLEFIARVQRETGLRLEVISREAEARYAVAGCASLLDFTAEWALVFDIGGGSSELVWLDMARLGGARPRDPAERMAILDCIAGWTSLPVGVVNLAERFGGASVDLALYERMAETVAAHLERFDAETGIGARLCGGKPQFLGTSGTVTTLAGIHLGLPVYSRSKVDGLWLSPEDVRAISRRLIDMGFEGRVAEPCIGPERADLVLAGCAILEALLRVWPCGRLRVADRGLREGLLTAMMAEDGSVRSGRRRHKYSRLRRSR